MVDIEPTEFDVLNASSLRKGDYVSPGLRLVVLDPCFPRMKEAELSYVLLPLLLRLNSRFTRVSPSLLPFFITNPPLTDTCFDGCSKTCEFLVHHFSALFRTPCSANTLLTRGM